MKKIWKKVRLVFVNGETRVFFAWYVCCVGFNGEAAGCENEER